jgi:hypothetical protein
MMQLHGLSLTKAFPARGIFPVSLDCLEVGESFNVVGTSLRPVLRTLLYGGIAQTTDLVVISRDRYSIFVRARKGPQSLRIRVVHAKHIVVRSPAPA